MAEDINKLPADIFPLTLGCEVQVLQCARKHVYSIESELPRIIFFNFVTHEPHCGQNLKSLFNSSSNTMYFFVLSGELQQVASTTASSTDAVSISTFFCFVRGSIQVDGVVRGSIQAAGDTTAGINGDGGRKIEFCSHGIATQ